MKRETLEKIVVSALYNMSFGMTERVDKVNVPFEIAFENGLISQLSNIIRYQDCRFSGFKEDVIITYTESDNAINIFTTKHDSEDKAIGYIYKSCVLLTGKNQIDVSCELCLRLAQCNHDLKY